MQSLRFEPVSTALLVVDLQNSYCHSNGCLAKVGIDVTPHRRIISNVQRLIKVCRGLEVSIIWILQEHFVNDRTLSLHKIPTTKQKLKTPDLAARGTWEAELIDEMKMLVDPSDYMVKKSRSSAFYNTNLEQILKMLGIKTTIVTGISTNICVESTVRDASFRDYDVVVVSDCVASPKEHLHKTTLENVDLYFGAVLSSEAVLVALSQANQETTSKQAS